MVYFFGEILYLIAKNKKGIFIKNLDKIEEIPRNNQIKKKKKQREKKKKKKKRKETLKLLRHLLIAIASLKIKYNGFSHPICTFKLNYQREKRERKGKGKGKGEKRKGEERRGEERREKKKRKRRKPEIQHHFFD